MKMKLVQLLIKGISSRKTLTGGYALILVDEYNKRKLPIIIGEVEAQSIALGMEKEITSPRPLTHDLFISIFEIYQIKIEKIIIYKLKDGIFYTHIHLKDSNNKEHIIDSRTSDAVAIALRCGGDIYTTEKILNCAGIIEEQISSTSNIQIELESLSSDNDQSSGFSNHSREELQKFLEKALVEENYEFAAKIRDEINKRK